MVAVAFLVAEALLFLELVRRHRRGLALSQRQFRIAMAILCALAPMALLVLFTESSDRLVGLGRAGGFLSTLNLLLIVDARRRDA